MERLNDIMGRTSQRRYLPRQRSDGKHATNEQAQLPQEVYTRPRYVQYQGTGQSANPAPGQRSQQRPRQGQQGQPTTPASRNLSQGTRQHQGGQTGQSVQGGQRGYGSMDANQRERRGMGENRNSTGAAPRQGDYSRQQPLPEESNYAPRQRALEENALNRPVARPPASYHHGDSYQRTQADVADEREGEDYEEIHMEYGEWEGNEQEVTVYRRPEQESHPRSDESDYDFPTDIYARESHDARFTGNMRATRGPFAGQEQAPPHPPVPSMRTREMQLPPSAYRTRRTQPLDPRVLAEFERDQHISTGEPAVRAPRVPRQPVVREPAVVYPSTALPIPVTPHNVCPVCKGAGYLRVDVPFGHPNFGKPVPCECKEAERKEKRRQQLIELSDLSAFHNKSFKNFNIRFQGVHPSVQDAFHAAREFAHNPNGWLVLIGPNGCGKTHLAAAIANQTLSDGAVVLFTVVPDLLALLRATFGPSAPEAYEQRFAKMREAEVLILDDLGAHQSSAWANEKLFQLLNYRYNSAYPTVITANKQGLTGLDERIVSRINDNALVTRITMNGALDYRPQNPRR